MVTIHQSILAQIVHYCGFDEIQRQHEESNNRGGGGYDYVEYVEGEYPQFDYICPVVVHVIHNNGPENISDCQIVDAINQANEQLTTPWDTRIRLQLANIDPLGNCTSGIERIQVSEPWVNVSNQSTSCGMSDLELKQLSMWPQDRYLNIYIVSNIIDSDDDPCNYNTVAAGYVASIPFIEALDGIVMLYSAFGNTEAASNSEVNWVHEVGHFFYLYHPWGNNLGGQCSNCHSVSECLTHGDLVCDTNPTIANAGVNCFYMGNFCPSAGCTNDYDYGQVSYPSESYMSYNFDCQFFFSPGQATRMQWCLYHDRPNLGTLWAQELAGLNETPIVGVTSSDCNSYDFTVPNCFSAQTIQWDFGDGTPLEFGSTVNHNYSCSGVYEITCMVYRCIDYPEVVTSTVVVECGEILPAYDSFVSNESCFAGCNGSIVIENFVGTITWLGPDGSSYNGTEISNLCPGSYFASFEQGDGCYTHEFEVQTSPYLPLELTVAIISNSTCNGCCTGSVDLSAAGGNEPYVYAWNGQDSGELVNQLCAGSYTAMVTDNFGCQSMVEIEISQPELFEFSNLQINEESCNGVCEGLLIANWSGGQSPYNVYLNGELMNENTSLTQYSNFDLCSDDYELVIADAYDNIITETFTITVTDVAFINDLVLNEGDPNPFSVNQTFYFGGDIIIESGEFNVSSATLKFAFNSKVIVEEGAKLSFDYCTLTTCGQRWEGIEVKSNSNTIDEPGELYVNKSKIYFASKGIQTEDADPEYTQGVYSDSDGNLVYYWIPTTNLIHAGNIYCQDSEFLNNRVAISISSSVLSQGDMAINGLVNCRFVVDDELYEHFNYNEVADCEVQFANFQRHIYLSHIKNLKIKGCEFHNLMSNPENFPCGWRSRGVGIFASDALFLLEDNGLDRNEFTGFNYAIHALITGNPWNGLKVNHAIFHKNKIATLFDNVCYHEFVNCHVAVGEPTGIPMLDSFSNENADALYYEGLVQLRGNYFKFADNYFLGTGSTQQTIGIRIRDTNGMDFSDVHNNALTGFFVANKADGKNFNDQLGTGVHSGLRYTCQHNSGNYIDFEVDAFSSELEVGIGDYQMGEDFFGGIPSPSQASGAGSEFSPSAYSHFLNNGDYDITYLHSASEQQPINNVVGMPNLMSVDNPNECTPYDDLDALELITNDEDEVNFDEDDTSGGPDIITWVNYVNDSKPELLWVEYLLESLIDGGSTGSLVNSVNWSTNVWDIRLDLLAKSPYLSKDVLLSVADNTSLIPHAIALEVFLANPDMLRDKSFIIYLGEKQEPLPQYMIDILIHYADIGTLRRLYGQLFGFHRSIIGKYNGYITRELLRDPDSDLAYIYKARNESKSIDDEFSIVDEYLEHGELVEAESRLNAISDKNGLFGLQSKQEMLLFNEWFALRIEMINDQTNWFDLNADQLAQLQTWSTHFNTWTGKRAIGVLTEYYGKNAYIAPAFDGWTGDLNKSRQLQESSNASVIQVFPIPADELLTFIFKDQTIDQDHSATIRIYNLMGDLIFDSIQNKVGAVLNVDASHWASGVYMYQLELPYQRTETGKFEIIH